MSTELKRIIEALLFVAEEPLSLKQLCELVETGDKGEVGRALDELAADYDQGSRAFMLKNVAGGWCLRTRPELSSWLRRLRRQQVTRLSKAALETLAVVAYKQPVLKAEIERLRGVEVAGVLRSLLEKGLIRVLGRQDLPGRPLIYGTTRRFLEVFDLPDLKDLPSIEEMEQLAGEMELAFGPMPPDEDAEPSEDQPAEPPASQAAGEQPSPDAAAATQNPAAQTAEPEPGSAEPRPDGSPGQGPDPTA